jgi:hypothetical protein
MTTENLEQKVGLMDNLRGFAGKTVGAYALTLALGGAYGCGNDVESCNGTCPSCSGSKYCSRSSTPNKCKEGLIC